jgi:beta-galactosidase GanA
MTFNSNYRFFVVITVIAFASLVSKRTAASNLQPHLESRHGVRQMVVDGSPFLMLGGELNNSSSSSREYMKPIWPELAKKNLNTVLAAVTWELTEPVEGKFDFSVVDGLIQDARAHNMHLVFLWFGSWKNGESTYVPYWVKTNPQRFPLIKNGSGQALNVLTTFSAATRDADARAFGALMRHIREVDGQQHTVLMMQVENETGVLGDTRDRSAVANRAYAGLVPAQLMN